MSYNTFDIPGYTLIRKVGEGGVGAVWLATDTMLQRQVAVKALKPDISQEKENMQRFQSEAVTLAKLRHPNITMLYNLIHDKGRWYMIMEYIEGETLETLLKNRGVLPVIEMLSIAIQALDGLQHAHNRGVIHRDLKPFNLMLSAEGEVKIMDFGIARIAGGSRLTRVGQAVGTPQYMSPEQVRGQEGNYASDIYSFGVVLYELLTGVTPFDSDSEFEIMHAHTSKKPVPPDSLNPEIPGMLNDAILKALAKDPSQRFSNVSEFRQRLQQIIEQLTTASPSRQAFSFLPFRWKLPKISEQWRFPVKMDRQYLVGIIFLSVSLIIACFMLFRNSMPESSGLVTEELVSDKQDFIITEPNADMEAIVQSNSKPTTPLQNFPVTPPVHEKNDPNPVHPKIEKKEKEKKREQLQKDNPPVQELPKDMPPEQKEQTQTQTIPSEPDRSAGKTTTGKQIVIPRGTRIDLILDNSYEYDSAPDGMRITLSVSEVFERSGIRVIMPGAKAYALLHKNTRKRELEIEMLEVESVTGQRLRSLNTTYKASAFRQGERFKMNLEYSRFTN
ncbi:MAG: serine/threonine protein kinase [Tannerella sp.]|jgi:serine/threonine-protein kinase|nr:serine/threonine protein kinase [Tannerella sp.]